MIYFGSFFAGIINGLFASGAGQILVFVLVFILKENTYKSRATSVFAIGVVTMVTVIRYLSVVEINISQALLVSVIGFLFGMIGTKLMQKIPAGYLNLISGVLVTGFAIYSLVVN